MNTKRPTPTQQPANTFQNIDADQLDTIVGGCACGCGQASCTCAGGSCAPGATPGTAPAATQPRPFGWF